MDEELYNLVCAVEAGKIGDPKRALPILAEAAQSISAALSPEAILRRQGEYYRQRNKDVDLDRDLPNQP